MSDHDSARARRAEAARQKILASGDQELIRRLYLLEAASPPQGAPVPPPSAGQPAPRGAGGPGLLGMGLAVAGGAWLGTVLGGMTLSGEMQQAFADVAEDLGFDMEGVDMASLSEAEADIDPDADFGGDLGDFFDI